MPVPVVTILLVEDDEDDYVLTRDALAETELPADLRWVRDGGEALDYLRHEGGYGPLDAPRPALILLDLNMPRMGGREFLEQIKADERFRTIPIVVLTTSDSKEDVIHSYGLGVNSFIQKPVDFERFTALVRGLTEYWFRLVKLPK